MKLHWMALLSAVILSGVRADRSLGGQGDKAQVALASTRISEMAFREAPIETIVDFLSRAAQSDPREAGDARNINFMLNLHGSTNAGSAATSVAPITFRARDISLLDALNAITQIAGLKYRIEGNVVLIVPSSAPDGPIIHRAYQVLPTVGEKARAITDGRGE